MTDSTIFALTSSRERTASTTSGYLMLLLLLLAIAVQVFGIVNLARDNHTALVIAAVVVMPFVILFIACGFYMLQPNQAAGFVLDAIGGFHSFAIAGGTALNVSGAPTWPVTQPIARGIAI